MPDVRITLLGGFAAAVDGEPVPDRAWRLKKAREPVKLLALARDHRLHREQVMDVLWRDLAPAAAANNLHQAVHVARRALHADAIAVRDEMLSLDAVVDVDAFEEAAAEARRAGTADAYRAALARYGGEPRPRTATTTGLCRGETSSRQPPPRSRRSSPSSRRQTRRAGSPPTRARSSAASASSPSSARSLATPGC